MICFLFSCSNNNNNKTEIIKSLETKKMQNLTFVKKDFNDLFMGRPTKIKYNNNILYLIDLFEGNTTTIYDCEADSLVGRFFSTGQGPDDVSWPLECNIIDEFYSVYERQSGRYREYKTKDLIFEKNYTTLKDLKFEMTDQLIKTDFGFIATGMFESGLINFYDQNGNVLLNLDPFDGNLNEVKEQVNRFVIGQGKLSYNITNKSFLYATYFTGDIFVFKYINGDLIKNKHLKIGKEIIKRNRNNYDIKREHEYHILDIGSSKKYHYILYGTNSNNTAINSRYLLKIDTIGNIVSYYKVHVQMSSIFVSDDDSYIQGIVENEEGEYDIIKAAI